MDDREKFEPPAEARLIRRHRQAAGLSIAEAAEATNGVVGPRRWAQIEQGFLLRGGEPKPTEASDAALAHMAFVVGVSPEELEAVHKAEAAAVLRTIRERQLGAMSAGSPAGGSVAPNLEGIARWFADESIPAKERAEAAHRFLRMLPYFLKGQTPPPDLFEDYNEPDNGQRSA